MRKGFTLLELLVTISIIGLLLGIGAVSFSTAQKRGRDSRRQGDMKAIQKSLEQCYSIDTKYPQTAASDSSLDCSDGTMTMNQVPSDPQSTGSYTYTVDSDPATVYCLCSLLENIGKGNASDDGAGGGGSCTWDAGGVDNNYFCVSNQQ